MGRSAVTHVDTDALLRSLARIAALDQLPRTGWIQGGIAQPESIAGHLVNTAFLAAALAPRVDPPLPIERVVLLALMHDAPEALTGDLPHAAAGYLPKGAKRAMEAGAARELFAPLGDDLQEAFDELQGGTSRAARFVHAVDKLALGVRLLLYRHSGQGGLESFERGLANHRFEEFDALEALRRSLLERLSALASDGSEA